MSAEEKIIRPQLLLFRSVSSVVPASRVDGVLGFLGLLGILGIALLRGIAFLRHLATEELFLCLVLLKYLPMGIDIGEL